MLKEYRIKEGFAQEEMAELLNISWHHYQRIEIVKAISYVDRVVPQISMDKFEAWKELKFNALFHGDDWKGSSLYEKYEKIFSEVGVDLIFLPHTSGTSSTLLSEKLSNIYKV